MTRTTTTTLAAVALAVGAACGPAQAATFGYTLAVTESVDGILVTDMGPVVAYDLPALGTAGTLTIDLAVDAGNAADPIPPEFTDISSIVTVSATFGSLSTGLDPAAAQINPRPGRAQFRNGEFSALDVTLPGALATGTLAGSFSVSSASFGPGSPATLGDVRAILSAPDAVAVLSFNGTAAGTFVSFAARSDVAPIPLPAGGLLLVSGLGALAAARRRRR